MKVLPGHLALTLGLLGANALLIAVLALEMRFPVKVEPMGQHAPAATPETHLLPDFDFALQPLDRYVEIIERPLFRETRRAPEPEEATETETPQQAGRGQSPPFVLTGVNIAADRREALLVEVGGKEVWRVQQGDEIRGWRLETVGAENVVLRRGELSQELRLERKSGVPGAKATTPKQRSRR